MSKHNKGNGIYFETESTTGWIFNKAFISTGRIKRMRSDKDKGLGWINVKTIRKIARPELIYKIHYDQIKYPTITRWNRH